ncbi:MAG: group II intron maturase-specific domain-containing protein [Lachnotalea sp.]
MKWNQINWEQADLYINRLQIRIVRATLEEKWRLVKSAMSMEYRALKLRQTIIGWGEYFNLADMKSVLKYLDEWLRRRLRLCYWKQWKKIKTKHDNLVKLGINNYKAWEYANTRKGYWRICASPILSKSLTNQYLKEQKFITLSERYLR